MEQKIINNIELLLEILSDKRTLLVCGSSFDRLEIAPKIHAEKLLRFSCFSPNPLYEDVCRGVELFRSGNCDAILAVGGGSAMDVAKCIKLFAKMDPGRNYLQQEYRDTGILLAAIPTTAGTGSESTRHAVIYYQGEKQSISHASLVPDYACLIPSVLENLPVYQKKCTMLDALCQAIESYWSVNSTEESKEYSRRAITAIRDHWRAYIEGNAPEATEIIQRAANDSGRAINITATTAPHAMSYKLTSLYGLPHGHAVALCLLPVWEFLLAETDRCTDARGADYLKQTLAQLPVDADWFAQLLTALDMVYPTARDREAEIEILTASVNPVRLKNNPVLPDEQTLRGMYERIVQ